MPAKSLKLLIRENDRTTFETPLAAPLVLGRQQAEDVKHGLGPCTLIPAHGSEPARLIVVPNDKKNVGRRHLFLEPLPTGTVRVSNGSQVPVPRSDGPPIPAGASVELTPPFTLLLSGRSISIVDGDSFDEHGVRGLDDMTLGPASLAGLSRRAQSFPDLQPGQTDAVMGWLQATLGVLQSAVGSSDFLHRAAEALVQIVGLDSGRALLLDGEDWHVAARNGDGPEPPDWKPSRHVLNRVRAEKKTFWQRGGQPDNDSASLAAVGGIVAAPLLDRHDTVIGALYGERFRATPFPGRSGRLQPQLVDLLAFAVSTGLARQEQERAALELRVQLGQFFNRELSEQLARDPTPLRASEKTVSLLFCDVRGFSSFSEALGPERTMTWMNEVMGALSECVLAEGGVLVDYVGDELFAMWGAPEEQSDQQERAVRAGLAMLDRLPGLNDQWRSALGMDMGIGVGINSGTASVGNTGSRFKFKYGPLGNAVNLASRVQGLTKYLGVPLLVTRATREALGQGFIARRVVKTRVVNINEPVDLFQIDAAGDTDRAGFFAASEAALDALEKGDFANAASRSGSLLEQNRGDGPLRLILSRASAAIFNPASFDAVWEPPGK
jgi:adenylate cyclase